MNGNYFILSKYFNLERRMKILWQFSDFWLTTPLTSISMGLWGWHRVSHRILNLEDRRVGFVYTWRDSIRKREIIGWMETRLNRGLEIMEVSLQHLTMFILSGKQVTGVLTTYIAENNSSWICLCVCVCVCVCVCACESVGVWEKDRNTHAPGPRHVHVTVSCGEEGGRGSGSG